MIAHLYRRLAIVFTVWSYFLAAPPALLVFGALAVVWRRDPARRARRLQRITVGAYRFMHDWLRWTRIAHFDHRAALPGIPDGPCVVIANHPTLMDITAIHALLGAGFTIVKPELFQRRMLRPFLSASGNIEGPGTDVLAMRRVIEEASERLGAGFRLIVFPEGTRSRGGRLGRFGRAPFEIACRAGVPLVCLTIRCEPPYLTKGVPLYRPARGMARLEVGLLGVEHPDEATDSRALRERVEARYEAWLRADP